MYGVVRSSHFTRFTDEDHHQSLYRQAICALFHGTVKYANTKRQSLVNCSALIYGPKIQDFLRSLHPTLEQKNKSPPHRPTGKIVMEKVTKSLKSEKGFDAPSVTQHVPPITADHVPGFCSVLQAPRPSASGLTRDCAVSGCPRTTVPPLICLTEWHYFAFPHSVL